MTSLKDRTDLLLVLADTETTGVGSTDKIVELAWAELDENLNTLRMVRSLIDPQQPICAAASGVHGIIDADVADAPTIEEFFSQVEPGALQQPLILIGHNIKFDWRFLKPHVPNMVALLDTLKLARKYFPEAPNHKLDTLRYFLDLYKGNAHRADEDVKTTIDLLQRISKISNKTVWELLEESNAPLQVRPTFGSKDLTPLAEGFNLGPGSKAFCGSGLALDMTTWPGLCALILPWPRLQGFEPDEPRRADRHGLPRPHHDGVGE